MYGGKLLKVPSRVGCLVFMLVGRKGGALAIWGAGADPGRERADTVERPCRGELGADRAPVRLFSDTWNGCV
jgi:hypothetical protein